MKWTRFMDMHSGGGTKEEDYEYIYIEASEDKAVTIFINRFGHNPNSIACDCCGGNYSVSEYNTLEKATKYERDWDKETLEQYIKKEDVLIIKDCEIKKEERIGL